MERHLTCAQCGCGFVAARSDAKYCSNRCKQAAKRGKGEERRVWREPPAPPGPAMRDVESALTRAHRAANDLGRLASSGPYQLRAACARISAAIQLALEAEGL